MSAAVSPLRRKALGASEKIGRNSIIVGEVFVRLTVLEQLPTKKGHHYFLCRCECGKETEACHTNLRSGHTQSCGCFARESSAARRTQLTHGDTGKPEHRSWWSMISRCTLRSDPHFDGYGGRGITVCKRWLKYENFLVDMGRKPSPKHSIERKNNNSGYSPANCKWALPLEQCNNKRSNVFVVFRGERLTISQAARKSGILKSTLRRRLRMGFPLFGPSMRTRKGAA